MKGWMSLKTLIFALFFGATVITLLVITPVVNKGPEKVMPEPTLIQVSSEDVQLTQVLYQLKQINCELSNTKDWQQSFIEEQLSKLPLTKTYSGFQKGEGEPDFIYTTDLDETSVVTFLTIADKIAHSETKKSYLFTPTDSPINSLAQFKCNKDKIDIVAKRYDVKTLLSLCTVNTDFQYGYKRTGNTIQIITKEKNDDTMTIVKLSNYALTVFNVYDRK